MRLSGEKVTKQPLDTNYIDTRLKDLSYEHASHLVRMRYGDTNDNEKDVSIVFRNCFSANFNTWLEGMKGTIPKNPGDLDYFFHEITIEDIEINGVLLYKCSMIIPMMDCQITCVTIEINY